ncbi:MAG: CHAT domain-containing protein [Candidatus Aminicenantes bacterium]
MGEQALQELDDVKGLLKEGNYVEAKELAQKVLSKIEDKYGNDSLQTAQVLEVLVDANVGVEKQVNEETRGLIDRAITILERKLGPDHPEVMRSLVEFSSIYQRAGDYARAKELNELALSMANKTFGPDHIETSSIMHSHGVLLHKIQDYVKAKQFLYQALKIQEEKLGPEHLDVASTLSDIGLFLEDTGEPAEANSTLERAYKIREKTLDPEHVLIARSLQSLGIVLHTMGDYAGAKNYYDRALPILEKTNGPNHQSVGSIMNDLGYLYKDMGDYTKAIECHGRALAIREKVYGDNHPTVAHSLNNLAVVLRRTGEYERAKALLERSLKIFKSTFGNESPMVAMALINLSNVLSNMRDFTGATFLAQEAVSIQEKVFGSDNMKLIPYIGNYAICLEQTGRQDEAIDLIHRTLKIQEKNLGPNHPDVSSSLINLASLEQERGNIAEALALIERAQINTEKSAGPDHPLMAMILRHFARYLWCAGRINEAIEKAWRSEEIIRNHTRLISRGGSERQALAFAAREAYIGFDICLSLAVKHPEEIHGFVSKAWDTLIRSRAFLLDEMATRHRTVVERSDPEVADLVESLAAARQRLANLMVRGPNPGDPEENYINLLEKTTSEKEQAERILANASTAFNEEMTRSQVGFTEVKSSLPSDSALVAFAYYFHNKLSLMDELRTNEIDTDSYKLVEIPTYVAFVLQAQNKEPMVIPLGKAEEIEPLIFDWSQEAARGTRIPGRSNKDSEVAYRSSGEILRQKVWDPIIPYVGGAKQVIIVPDSSLYAVNFASLPINSKEYLIEKGPLIHYLSAERDIVSSDGTSRSGVGLLALGDPAYDEISLFSALSPEHAPKQSLIERAKSVLFRGERSQCMNFKSMEFKPLPATNKEIDEITEIWEKKSGKKRGIEKFTSSMADEQTFKLEAPGKQILHLATHGFFLEGDCPLPAAGTENPLLLSGIALAGANHRESAGPDEDDGILTAEEVAALDLSGVELVVLSACDTGIGKITEGEGVYGLQRAFRVAGAQKLVTSLWAVEDEATRAWMKAFYEALLSKGLGTAEAVRAASLSVLQERRKKNKGTHPFYWAGFVASGDWK